MGSGSPHDPPRDVAKRTLTCGSCGEGFKTYGCPQCRDSVFDRCQECHDEVVHGSIWRQDSPTVPRHPHPRKMLEDEDQNRRSDA